MARKGMTLREQSEVVDELARLKARGRNAAANARSNKDEGKQAVVTVLGGAAAGALDATQAKLLAETGENPYKLVEDVPTEGIISFLATAYGIFGKRSSKMRKYALSAGAGGLAYTVGNAVRNSMMEG